MKKHQPITLREMIILSLMDAVLIVAQMIFGMIAGIEIVTVLYLCFSLVFGWKMSWLLGIIFSITRCLIYGFYPNVLLLYLIFYSICPWIIWLSSRYEKAVWVMALSSVLICIWVLLSPLPKLVWINWMAGVTCLILVCLLVFIKKADQKGTGFILIVFCTLLFTCIDDGLAVLINGFSFKAAYGYFLASLPVMILQAFNNLIAFSLFSIPLSRVFNRLHSSLQERKS